MKRHSRGAQIFTSGLTGSKQAHGLTSIFPLHRTSRAQKVKRSLSRCSAQFLLRRRVSMDWGQTSTIDLAISTSFFTMSINQWFRFDPFFSLNTPSCTLLVGMFLQNTILQNEISGYRATSGPALTHVPCR
jgi:hypothetical protein